MKNCKKICVVLLQVVLVLCVFFVLVALWRLCDSLFGTTTTRVAIIVGIVAFGIGAGIGEASGIKIGRAEAISVFRPRSESQDSPK